METWCLHIKRNNILMILFKFVVNDFLIQISFDEADTPVKHTQVFEIVCCRIT